MVSVGLVLSRGTMDLAIGSEPAIVLAGMGMEFDSVVQMDDECNAALNSVTSTAWASTIILCGTCQSVRCRRAALTSAD